MAQHFADDPEPAESQDDETALRQLREVHGPVLLNYLSRLMLGDYQRAEDIVQETLVRAWRNPQARSDGGGWSRGWIFTVAKRILIDQIRAADSRPDIAYGEDVLDVPGADDVMERMIDAAEVRSALAALPERLRLTLTEVYYNDRPIAEVAEIHGVPEGTVKSRTFYALKALRDELIARGFDVQHIPGQGSTTGRTQS